MIVWVDSREKPKAIGKILKQFEAAGVQYITNKLPCGDYMNMENPFLVIDRKQDLQELCGNVTQQHRRFIAELDRAKDMGIKLIILCSHSPGINSLEDVASWENPRLATSPKATTGERLARILHSIEVRHGCKFMFCSKANIGTEILRILQEGAQR